MKRFVLLFALSLVFSIASVFAAETGLFYKSVEINGETRSVWFYVPDDYDESEPYKLMVCLHGMGDTGENFARYISSAWKSVDFKMIYVCPDGGDDSSRDFYTPEGDEQIIDKAIDSALTDYNIDENRIIIQGFSLGGRSAFKYGTDNSEKVGGLLLCTPAFQGPKDASNDWGWFDLTHVNKIPMVFIHGTEDIFYVNPVKMMYDNVVKNNGIAKRFFVEGMKHSVPDAVTAFAALDYIWNPYQEIPTVEILNTIDEQLVAKSTYTPKILIRNNTEETFTEAEFELSYESGTKAFSWSGELAPYETAEIETIDFELTQGVNEYNCASIDTETGKEISKVTGSIVYQDSPLEIPYMMGFEENGDVGDNYWTIQESGNWVTWGPMDMMSKTGEQCYYMLNSPLYFDNGGLAESFTSPYIDIRPKSEDETVFLSFDLAWNYLLFDETMTTSGDTLVFADTLEIKISTDGGNTFSTIFRGDGIEYSTAKAPLVNANSVQKTIFIPDEDEWKYMEFDLSEYKDATNAIFKFDYISGYGGSISIDNFTVSSMIAGVKDDNHESEIALYPNPAESIIQAELESPGAGYEIYSAETGTLEMSGNINNMKQISLNIESLPSGAYIFKTITEKGYKSAKFIKK